MSHSGIIFNSACTTGSFTVTVGSSASNYVIHQYDSLVISHRHPVAKKSYHCQNCGKIINPGDRYFRMFGAADPGDKPYEMIECETCHTQLGVQCGHCEFEKEWEPL